MVYGHEQIVKMILGARANGRLAHAYLFIGPEGIGKYTTARALARSLVCEKTTDGGEACTACSQCKASEQNTHPDITVLMRDPEKKEIGIQTIRDLRAKVEQTSFFLGYRVVIIDEADTMTTEAANALLRILEEPRGKTIFFLCAANGRHVLPTIRSRTVSLNFEPIPVKEVQSILEREGVARSQAASIAHATNGRIGVALTLARDAEAWEQFSAMTETIDALFAAQTWTDRRRMIEKNYEELSAPQALRYMYEVLNTKLAGSSEGTIWIRCLEAFARLTRTLETTNVQPLFAFEQFLLSLP